MSSVICGFPGWHSVKINLPMQQYAGDVGSIPGSGRSPGGGNGNAFQYSCLENPMARGAWWATVHRVTEGKTRLRDRARTLPVSEEPECEHRGWPSSN